MRSRMRMLGVAATSVVTVFAGSGVASASAPTSAQKQALSALTGKPTAAPAAVKSFIDGPVGRQFGVDAAHVYRVPAPTGGSWSVLPGSSDKICVVFETHENVSTCGTLDEAKAGQLSLSLVDPDPNGGDRAATGHTTYLGYAPKTLTPSLMSSAGPSKAVKAGFYEVAGKSARLSSLLSRRARAFQKHRVNAPAAPRAKAAGSTIKCIPDQPRSDCAFTWYYGTWGGAVPLTAVTVYSYDGNNICGNAAAYPAASWAGSFVCTTAHAFSSHPYNGSWRTPWAGPSAAVGGTPGYQSASGIGVAIAAYNT